MSIGETIFKELIEEYDEEEVYIIVEYLRINDILDDFINVTSLDEMMELSIKYGIYQLMKYLYEEKKIKIKTSYFYKSINDKQFNGNLEFNICVLDRYTEGRKDCLNYFNKIKKSSKYKYENKDFVYRFKY